MVLATFALMSTSCTADSSGQVPDNTVRVSPEAWTDISEPLPDNAGAFDLGEFAPPDDLSFCEAFAAVPVRYIEGPLIGTQVWVDSFVAARSDAPSTAVGPIDRLVEFGELTLAAAFGLIDEAPTPDSSLAADGRLISDIAVEECSDLPLVVGPPDQAETPAGWREATPEELVELCQRESDGVDEGIAWYRAEFGKIPEHQQQIETAANEAWYSALEELGDYPVDEFSYRDSFYYGVGVDGTPAVVPGGACDT